MKTLTTDEIAQAVGGSATKSADITSVVIDNREVTPGCLFVAICGERLDGHQFISAAVEAGASAVLVSKDVETTVPVIKVKDTKKALLDMARAYRSTYGLSVEEFPLVGLTGSVGKTTTKEMIWCVLNAKYKAHKTYMNWNNEIGVPRVLLSLEGDHTAAVVEMGMDHKGEISELVRTVLPNIAVITNIGVSHIENLGSREAILAAKLEITEGLKENGPLIINTDNDLLSTVKEEDFTNRFKIVTFGIKSEKADVLAKNIEFLDNETRFVVCSKNAEDFSVTIPATGEHNVYDALAAVCVGLELNIEPKEIKEALKSYTPAGMREKITQTNGITFIEDCYNASPDSVKALSETIAIKGRNATRKIAVIADMLELGEFSDEAHKKCGEYLAEAKIDLLMTYGEKAKLTAEAGRSNGILRVFDFDTKEELSAKLIEILKPGDVIAFKGSRGMKLEDVIEKVRLELLKKTF